MFNLLMILVGSAMIGFGMDSVLMGTGVGCIAASFHFHFNARLVDMHDHPVVQMQTVYNKIN